MSKARKPGADAYETGLELAKAGRHLEAIARFEAALAVHPDDERVLFALGNVAEALGNPDAAEQFFLRVLARDPDRLEALVNLGNLLRQRGRTGEAIALLKPAIERNPQHADLWMTLGSALREAGDTTTAELFYREALRLSPTSGAALGNLAEVLADSGQVGRALQLYDRVIAADPGNAQARLNRALLRLGGGDLVRGWRDYDARLDTRKGALVADHGLPRWDGGIEPGLRLLVTAEQGLGDQIMFASLIPELAAALSRAGGRLILEAEPRLAPLFSRSFAGVRVRAADFETLAGRTLAHYDWLGEEGGADATIALASLPGLLRRRLNDFPSPHVYLRADAAERAHWQEWLRGQGPCVGLCWRSGLRGGLRDREYAPLEAWAVFVARLEAAPVSLQYDADLAEIRRLEALSGRPILVPPGLDQKQEVDRATALMGALDAVVSAPTSVAWMAAATGTPTLKVLYADTWTAFGAEVEPFAPVCRLIMPAARGDWADTFSRALAAV